MNGAGIGSEKGGTRDGSWERIMDAVVGREIWVRGRPHQLLVGSWRPVRKRGPPREAGGEGTVSPGELL